MKISNETKVGALTAIAITLLILGFNFLKGKTFFKTGNIVYAPYTNAKGLMVSNPVFVNGYQVGSVFDIENKDPNLSQIVVAIKLKENYNIPRNSVASIKDNPLGTPSIAITLGTSADYLKSGDTMITAASAGMLGDVMSKLGPVGDQVTATLHTLDSVLKNINSVFDPSTKGNLQQVIANMNRTTASLMVSSASLQAMLNQQTGALAQSMNNVNSFTKNLAANNGKITSSLNNLETATSNFSKADVAGVVDKLKGSVNTLNNILDKVNSQEGSLGKLMNDKTLYNNLINTTRSANILLDDLRMHPKRYVSISVFGKKDQSKPLTAPLNDTLPK